MNIEDKLSPLNIANPIEFTAEEYVCAMMFLDKENIPRHNISSERYSLVGRIMLLKWRDGDPE